MAVIRKQKVLRSGRQTTLLALLNALGPTELAARDQPGWTDKRADRSLRPVTARRRGASGPR